METFTPVYEQAIADIIAAFNKDNATIHAIDINVPNDVYSAQILPISDMWSETNYDLLSNAFTNAASLTGATLGYIEGVATGEEFDPQPPVLCLFSMLLQLINILNSYGSSIGQIGQSLIDSQFSVGDARPNV